MEAFAGLSSDLERAELDAVLTALARTPRLATLLRYLAEKKLQGRTDEITEYNLATQVFGRSKVTFDSSRDAIARVEASRLRKRLKEYYETDGISHDILIQLPSGTYVPAFFRRDSAEQSFSVPEPQPNAKQLDDLSTAEAVETQGTQDSGPTDLDKAGEPRARGTRKVIVLSAVAAAVVVLVVIFGAIRLLTRTQSTIRPNTGAPPLLNAVQPSPQGAAQVPLRMLAGYAGTPKIDSAGAYWQVDRYFHGGAAFRRPDALITRTSDPMLFDSWRTGDFTYDIPLASGPYELHLFFVALRPEEASSENFDVTVNGQPILASFNISSDALGFKVADERVFKDIYPDKDGWLHLAFKSKRAQPSLNAIEILPGLPHRQLPVRIVMQRAAVTDHSGNLWHPDNYYQNGALSDLPQQVGGTSDPDLYAQERFGHFTYSIPVDTHGRYTLILHFSELYWVKLEPGSDLVGRRLFRVFCNGSTLLDNFDIFKEAGSLHALTKTFSHLRPSSEGKLDLTFEPVVNNATVSAIEVIDESQ